MIKIRIFFLFVLLIALKFEAQNWQNLGGNENYNGYLNTNGSGYSGYSETDGEYSPRNLPEFFENRSSGGFLLGTLTWNVKDQFIYQYEISDDLVNFWIFNVATKQWKKISTNTTTDYGTKGVESPTNFPGKRTGSLTWVDNNGELWLYGNNYWPKQTDLWKYNPQTGNWTWISGTQNDSSFLPQQNTPNSNALPITYTNSYTWVDAQNNLWFFGGGKDSSTLSSSNQVWKYDTATNQWIWKKGNNDSDYQDSLPIYGTENVENPSNTPGEFYMYQGASWISGNFVYFFPGEGTPVLWKYNMQSNNWSYVKKPNNGVLSNFGTIGVENSNNFPPGLNNPEYWKDDSGNFWMFGGYLSDPTATSSYLGKKAFLNTLWKFNKVTNNWTWMKGKNPATYTREVNSPNELPYSPGFYGIKNIETSENIPHSRYKGIFWKTNNDLYLAYGEYYNHSSSAQDFKTNFKDIWKYNISSNNFTWTGGRSSAATEFTENKNQASVYNKPNVSNFISDEEGNLYAFHKVKNNEIWKFNINNQTWVAAKAGSAINYGTIGVEDSNNAPPNAKNLWYTNQTVYFTSDFYANPYATPEVSFWKFNTVTNNFTCLKKLPKPFQSPINVEDINNFPQPAYEAVNWMNDGKFYILGGGKSANFWEYNPANNIWKRLAGLPTNQIIENASFAKDSQKNIWVFGGRTGEGSSSSIMEYNNNVWKFDYLTKTWSQLQGGGTNKAGYYGTQNTSTNQTRPGTRYPSSFWMDENDRFWIYSGRGFAENTDGDYYNRNLVDLWYYDTKLNAWFWVDGYKNSFYAHDKELNYYDNTRLISSNYKSGNSLYSFIYNKKLYFIGESNNDFYNSTNQFWKLDISNIVPKYSFIDGFSYLNRSGGTCNDISVPFTRIKLKVQNTDGTSSESISNNKGYYRIVSNNLPATTLVPVLENPQYFTVTPASVNIDFLNGNSFSQNFCVIPNGTHNDLDVQLIPISEARPGFESTYRIIYLNKGNTTLSGQVKVDYQGSKITYLTSEITPDANLNSNLSWNFSDLKPFEEKSFTLTFKINPPTHPTNPVNSGDQLSFSSKIFPLSQDDTPLDNVMELNQKVVNSVDPNDKTCLEGNEILQENIGKYVHYLIRFENTGTANAINVVVKDFIDLNKFEIETLQPIKASHPYRMNINEGNKIEFLFENIQLPFPPNAQRNGYILFKIKTKTTLALGEQFSNKADIYFDYNFPIITNNAITTIVNPLATNETDTNETISFYPNPARDIITFTGNEKVYKIEIFDASGRLVKIEMGIKNNQTNINYLKRGAYILKLHSDLKISTKKLIKN